MKNARPSKAESSAKGHRHGKDMSTAAQRLRILEHLRAGPQTTYSLRARGVSHPAMRIKELIGEGYQITSDPVTAVDSDGFMHRGVALYSLIGEPDTCDLFSGLEVAHV